MKNYIECHPGQSGIIYCLTRKTVEEVSGRLAKEGFLVTRYHAGLSDAERKRNQEDFIYDRRSLMVATNAFGMGIDKSDVRFVIPVSYTHLVVINTQAPAGTVAIPTNDVPEDALEDNADGTVNAYDEQGKKVGTIAKEVAEQTAANVTVILQEGAVVK